MFVDEQFVGSQTEIKQITLTAQLVRDYYLAIDDHFDDKITTIPATLPFILWQYFSVPWLEGKGPLIHGNQLFDYNQNLQINHTYECFITFNKVYKKRNLQFLEHDLIIMENGKSASTFIIIGTKEENPHGG